MLQWIDADLQCFTLGLSEEVKERPEVTTHTYRTLQKREFWIYEGPATGCSSLDLPGTAAWKEHQS